MEDPEDILSSSLEALYGYTPITLSSAGSLFTYRHPASGVEVTLCTPDVHPSNWRLHASSIWVASRYLVDHLEELGLEEVVEGNEHGRILEFGASAGLPGITTSKMYPKLHVTVSDYPDDKLISTLTENVVRNEAAGNCTVVPFAWGSDSTTLGKFNTIIAADTLWSPELHGLFIQSLAETLQRSERSRIHLVAGLHTGRIIVGQFLSQVELAGFRIISVHERQGETSRNWDVSRAETELERRKWIVWIVLGWQQP